MDNLWLYLVIGLVVLILVAGFAFSLIRGRGTDVLEREAPGRVGDVDRLPPRTDDDLDLPGEESGDTIAEQVVTAPSDADADVEELEKAPTVERPDSARGRLQRLRARLSRSNTALGKGLLALLSRGRLDEEAWEEVEDTLIASDLGVEATNELVESLRARVKIDGTTDEAVVRGWLRDDLLALVQPDMDRRIASARVGDRPS
ncbi:MAG: signal recognition particle receptor subunit alpha, partial [Dermatophilaceae bacterium]